MYLNRRTVLGLMGGAALGATAPALTGTPAAAHGELQHYSAIWGQSTVDEDNGSLAGWLYRPSFHTRLNSWLEFWFANAPGSFHRPMRVWAYGVHTDVRESEAHNAGRGIDLTRIVVTIDGAWDRRFFARYDIWKDWTGEARETARRRYWATAASLHHHFRNVLTYKYNQDHWSHIHVDNLVSGMENSSYVTDSEAQTKHVQACCSFIWGLATEVNGVWNDATRRHSTAVLRRIGRAEGTIASSQANWLAFNRATMRKGYHVEEY